LQAKYRIRWQSFTFRTNNSSQPIDTNSKKEGFKNNKVDNYSFVIVTDEDSELLRYLSELEVPNLKYHLKPETIASDRSALEYDVLLLDFSSESTYSVGQICKIFSNIPVIVVLPDNYTGELPQLFQQGVSEYCYQNELSISQLQKLVPKTLLKFNAQLERQALSSSNNYLTQEYSSQLEDIVANSPMIACKWTSPDGYQLRFKYISENISQLGYSAEDILSGKVLWPDIVHPDDAENNRVQLFMATINGSNEVEFQYRVFASSGEEEK